MVSSTEPPNGVYLSYVYTLYLLYILLITVSKVSRKVGCVKYVTTNLEAAAPSSPAAYGRHFNGGHFNFDPREAKTQPGTD